MSGGYQSKRPPDEPVWLTMAIFIAAVVVAIAFGYLVAQYVHSRGFQGLLVATGLPGAPAYRVRAMLRGLRNAMRRAQACGDSRRARRLGKVISQHKQGLERGVS